MFLARINPRFDDLKDKEVVLGDQPPINDLALQIGITLGDEWGLDALGGQGRKVLKLRTDPFLRAVFLGGGLSCITSAAVMSWEGYFRALDFGARQERCSTSTPTIAFLRL